MVTVVPHQRQQTTRREDAAKLGQRVGRVEPMEGLGGGYEIDRTVRQWNMFSGTANRGSWSANWLSLFGPAYALKHGYTWLDGDDPPAASGELPREDARPRADVRRNANLVGHNVKDFPRIGRPMAGVVFDAMIKRSFHACDCTRFGLVHRRGLCGMIAGQVGHFLEFANHELG